MHIAFITVGDPARLTGGYLYHARLFQGLRAAGITVTEVVASGASRADQRLAAPRLQTTFDAVAYDVIVIDALARQVCADMVDQWRTIRPVVVLVHQLPSIAEAIEADIAIEQALEAPLLRADRLVAVSADGRDLLIARGVPPASIAVVSPGYNRLPLLPKPSKRPDETVQALCVAQWVPRKGIATLVAAWIQGGWRNATLELIGEVDADPDYAALIWTALRAALPGTVRVRGVVSDADLAQAYAAADLFVLPSRFEGYGMVYAEALAYGLPVVACNVGPVPSLVGPNAGLYVPPDDPDALCAALDRLLHEPAFRHQMAKGAQQQAATLPSWEDTIAGFQQVLADVVAVKRAS